MGWTVKEMALYCDGEYRGLFNTTKEMEELVTRLNAEIELRTGVRQAGMYSDADQELFVLGVMKNLHKKGTIVSRTDLVRMACRTYRGINAKELSRILERLLEKGYITSQVKYTALGRETEKKHKRQFYVINKG